jgi:RNA polymerase sigma-70 factor (ECF subfamily)
MGELDRAAFDRLVVEHIPAALRLAIRLCGDPHVAEDIAQEALLRAAKGWKMFRGESKFSTWLFRIVINAARDQMSTKAQAAEEVEEETVAASDLSPLATVQAQEFGTIVARCVGMLPARQREVLVLHSYEGFSDAQIATALGISDQNVRTTLHLARERMRAMLARYASEAIGER